MSYPTKTRDGKKFLGNKNKMEVHDLDKEDKNPKSTDMWKSKSSEDKW